MACEQSVVIVDDDDFFRKILERVFCDAGFTVDSFASADAFLRQYVAKPEACLILDLRMPGIGGLELQQQLRQRGLDLPVIICTGNADVPVTVQAMQMGAYVVIEKPLSSELLIGHVRAAISKTRAGRLSRRRIDAARAKFQLLTERETQVAKHVAAGLSATETAAILKISPRTVDAHRSNLFRKLEINSTAALVRLWTLVELGVE